jgi:lipopolysaccharide/colanic/teichoic acid biosynthesis glycosyltransferase
MQLIIKRFFDIIFSLGGIIILSPFFVLIAIAVALESRRGIFFKQIRVGKDGVDFCLYKFRTMKPNSEKLGQLTIGARDNRITRMGYFLRKYKLDELPQLFNVIVGDMSMVGPRPEVRKYVNLYSAEQLNVLKVKPGITDYASICYFNENDLLAQSTNPEQTYIQQIMPDKLRINLEYVHKIGVLQDFKIILITALRILNIIS